MGPFEYVKLTVNESGSIWVKDSVLRTLSGSGQGNWISISTTGDVTINSSYIHGISVDGSDRNKDPLLIAGRERIENSTLSRTEYWYWESTSFYYHTVKYEYPPAGTEIPENTSTIYPILGISKVLLTLMTAHTVQTNQILKDQTPKVGSCDV